MTKTIQFLKQLYKLVHWMIYILKIITFLYNLF